MRGLAWITVSILLVACGDDAADPDAGADAGRDASITDDGGGDAGISDDAGTDDAGSADGGSSDAATSDGGPIDVRQGTASLTQNRGLAPPVHQVFGAFYPELRAPVRVEEGNLPCPASATAGACGVYQCVVGPRASAGVITTQVDETVVAMVEAGSLGDHAFSAEGIVAEPGDVVTFAATGDEVPAFSGSVTMAGVITATLPTSVPRDAALTLTWSTSAAADRTQVVLAAGSTAIACVVDGADGTVTIAPELLGMLAAGGGFVGMTALNFETVTAGDYRVLLTAGDAVSGAVTIE